MWNIESFLTTLSSLSPFFLLLLLILLPCCGSIPQADRRRSLTDRGWPRERCVSLPSNGEESYCHEKTARSVSQEDRKGYKATTVQCDWWHAQRGYAFVAKVLAVSFQRRIGVFQFFVRTTHYYHPCCPHGVCKPGILAVFFLLPACGCQRQLVRQGIQAVGHNPNFARHVDRLHCISGVRLHPASR